MPDYSLLNAQDAAIPRPQVIGQRPIYLPPSGLNTLASGLAQGLQQGQQMNVDRQRAAIMQQQANVQQQMAPSQIALSQAQAQEAQTRAAQQQYNMSMMQQLAQAPQGQPQAQPMPQQAQGLANMAQPQGNPQQMPQAAPQQPQLTAGQQGSSDAYDNHVVQVYKQMGQPDMAQKYLESKQNLLKTTIANVQSAKDMSEKELTTKFAHLQKSGSIGFALTKLPDDQAVAQYNGKQGQIMRSIDPDNAPKAGSDPKEILAYIHAAGGALMASAEMVKSSPAVFASVIPDKSAQKDFVKDATTKNTDSGVENAQNLLTERAKEYQDAIDKFGGNSKEAQAAKENLDSAHDNVTKTTTPGIVQSVTGAVTKGISNVLSGAGNPSASRNALKSTQQPVNAQGKVWTYNPKSGKLE